MQAICVTDDRKLEIRSVPAPSAPPPGHLLVDIAAATVTHGDKFFLTHHLPGTQVYGSATGEVYGANGAGRVAAIGTGVPERYLGRNVAIYKSLARSPHMVGVWCERALVPQASCLLLPDSVDARELCGSFANVLTVQAFLDEAVAAGHRAVVVTAGTSATGLVAASLTRRRGVPALFLVRSPSARDTLVRQGVEHVLITTEEGFDDAFEAICAKLGATAVFDGVGGGPLTRLLPALPMNTTVYVYGFLGGPEPIALPTALLMGKNLTLRRFANLEAATVRDPDRLAAAVKQIEIVIGDPLLKTKIGKVFGFDQLDEALDYENTDGGRAILEPDAGVK